MSYKIYIPHYPKLVDRKDYISRSFELNGFTNYVFFEELNKEDIDEQIEQRYFIQDPDTIKDRIKYFIPTAIIEQFINDSMNKPEKSLALKHLSIYREFLKGTEEYLVVLEDDVIFVDHFNKKLEAYMKYAPQDFEILLFGAGVANRDGSCENSMFVGNKPQHMLFIKQHQHVFGRGCDSYIVTRETVKKLVEYFESIKICVPIDWELSAAAKNFRCYASTLFLTYQGSSTGVYTSSIRDRQDKYD